MDSTFTISLNNLHFHSKHGMYEEEVLVGNEFEVNLSFDISAPETSPLSIQDTINYAEVYGVVSDMFADRKPLLESIAMDIGEKLKERFPSIQAIQVKITKLHPPITTFQGSVSVAYNKQF